MSSLPESSSPKAPLFFSKQSSKGFQEIEDCFSFFEENLPQEAQIDASYSQEEKNRIMRYLRLFNPDIRILH